MAELGRDMSLADQKRLKPTPEDLIPYCFDGDKGMMKLASDFVAYIRETNKAKLSWLGRNAWRIKLKGEDLCVLTAAFTGFMGDNDAKWSIGCNAVHINEYEDKLTGEGMQHFILNNVNQCRRCGGRECVCRHQIIVTIMNNEYTFCRFVSIKVWDPDEKAVGEMKKLIELEKTARV